MTITDSRPGTPAGEGGAPGRAWTAQALCAQTEAADHVWFPHRNASPAVAQRICFMCPVRVACLTEALADPTLDGIWGGTTVQMRQQMRKAS